MAVNTDIHILPKNPAVTMINPAIISELILDGLSALGCLTMLDEFVPSFDRPVKMSFVGDVMIGRIPLYYPWADGEHQSGTQGEKFIQRTPNIYYALGSVDKEGFEDCPQAFQEVNDYVAVHVHSNESGIDLIKRLGFEILKKSGEFRVFFRNTDINNEFMELFL